MDPLVTPLQVLCLRDLVIVPVPVVLPKVERRIREDAVEDLGPHDGHELQAIAGEKRTVGCRQVRLH